MINWLKDELENIQKKDPAATKLWQIFITMPSIHIVINYKINNYLYRHNWKTLALISGQICKVFTGVEIHPQAQIGRHLFIDHGTGIVIGQTAIIGDDVTLFHGVTLGALENTCEKRHPTIKDNVTIGAGAKVLGNITIGNNVKIGANAVVVNDIADNKTAVGIPAKVIN